jgi:hypothetical protein
MQLAYTSTQPHSAAAGPAAGAPAKLRTAAADAPAAQEFLHRLAKTIQLMRQDHADAHFYREGCDALVQHAIGIGAEANLEQPLSEVMSRVAVGDYHQALTTLRTLTNAGCRA